MSQLRPIDLLKAAYDKKIAKVEFKIPLDSGKFLDAVLTAPDIFDIQEIQDKIFRRKFAEYRKEGLDTEPIDEAAWNRELEDTRKNLRDRGKSEKEIEDAIIATEKEKPQNMAQQGALKIAKIRTVQELIPLHLRDKKTGDFLFPSADDRRAFKEILCSDLSLMELLTSKYTELVLLTSKAEDDTKNSSEPENSESGNSEKPSQEDTASGPGTKGSKSQ